MSTFVTIKEQLEAGEKVFLGKETIQERIDNDDPEALVVRHVSLYIKLREMHRLGMIEENAGAFEGSRHYVSDGVKVRYVIKFRGLSKWRDSQGSYPNFSEPHDLAINPKTKTIIASSVSIM